LEKNIDDRNRPDGAKSNPHENVSYQWKKTPQSILPIEIEGIWEMRLSRQENPDRLI
jgi:hypothetical protein